jgi:hypothetical protein
MMYIVILCDMHMHMYIVYMHMHMYMCTLSAGIMTLLPSESGIIHLKASRIDQSHSQSQLYFSDVPFGPTMVSTCKALILYVELTIKVYC